MSKIKDLFAEYSGDEDLVVSAKEALEKGMIAEIRERIIKYADERGGELVTALVNDVELVESENSDGNKEYSLPYKVECELWAANMVDGYIEENALDLTDAMWVELNQFIYLYAMEVANKMKYDIISIKLKMGEQ